MKHPQASPARRLSTIVFILVVLLPIAASRADNFNGSVDNPNTTPGASWYGAGWQFWSTLRAAWSNYQDALVSATPQPSGTASPTDSSTVTSDVTAVDPSATAGDPTPAASSVVESSPMPALASQPSGQPLVSLILPTTVTALMATETSSSQVTLRWNPSTDVGGLGLAGYLVFRNGLLIGTTTAPLFVDTTVAPNTSYCYTIIAYDVGSNNALGSAENCFTTPLTSPPNPSAPGFYVDYSGGSDSNPGTNAAAPWKHCPGDPAATGKAAISIPAGSTVFFKGGESYVLTAANPNPYTAGIAVQSGTTGKPIVYDGQTWTGTKANITDNHSANSVIAFAALNGGMANVTIQGFDIGPVGGANPLPPDTGTELTAKPGWGVYSVGGPASNVNILNCDFHELGYWQNTKPMGPDSFSGSGNSPCGVQADGWVNCVISNCTFTKVHTGIALAYIYSPINNMTVANCDIHDYIVWGIDIASSPASACADNIYIHDNHIHDIGWAYGAGWTGYDFGAGSEQHQDPIFDRIGAGGTVAGCNGTNIDIYNNTFYDSEHYDSEATAYVSLTGGVSVNIYNNLFNLPNFNLFCFRNIDDIPSANSLVRIINNTFVFNLANANNEAAMSWETQGLDSQWSSLHNVQVYNNICYDFATTGAAGLGSSFVYTWSDLNTATCEANWSINHNLYLSHDSYGFADWYGQSPEQGGLSWMQARGWDLNSLAADPLFISLAYSSTTNAWLNNYGLQAGSPAIGAGMPLNSLPNLPGIRFDISGKTRTNYNGGVDLGAYQH